METTGNTVLDNLFYDAASGTLEFNGIRYMLIRPETIVEIQKAIEEKFGTEAAHEILYMSGHRGTSLTAKKLLGRGLTPDQCLEEMFQMGGHLGWGKFSLRKIEQSSKDEIEVAIQGSPFAKAYGRSDQTVCAILCGALAGIFSTLFGKAYRCTETHCEAARSPSCRFILKTEKKF